MGTALLDLIKRRRTVRKFADEDVTDDQLRSLLEAAVSAPTRYDTQPWHFVVLRDKPLQKRLAEAHAGNGFSEHLHRRTASLAHNSHRIMPTIHFAHL